MLELQDNAARRLASLMDALLTLARLGRTEMIVADVNLAGIAKAAAASLGEACENVSIELPTIMSVRGDARLLSLVLQNLLGNACKFSPRGGRVQVGEQVENGERRFFVRDEGIGFDMAHAGRLFLPFERLVRSNEFPGTGIGLANVKRIVERHGGRVWAESEPGEGSTFWFTLRDAL